jgi:acetaldehyde dehydrogenase
MRDTVFCAIGPDADKDAINESIHQMAATVQRYVPGYTLRSDPQFDDPNPLWHGNGRVAVFLEVRGIGDYLPEWAGNLDIMTAAAVRAGELITEAKTVKVVTK